MNKEFKISYISIACAVFIGNVLTLFFLFLLGVLGISFL